MTISIRQNMIIHFIIVLCYSKEILLVLNPCHMMEVKIPLENGLLAVVWYLLYENLVFKLSSLINEIDDDITDPINIHKKEYQ